MTTHIPRIDAQALRAKIAAGGELAILDVREEGVHARSHLLLASSCPVSRLEFLAERLVPRRDAPVVLVDDDESLAARAAQVLAGYGWSDVSILAEGMAGWRKAGFEVYSGVHVPSKAFGEYVEHRDDTPRISAADLKAKLDAGEKLVILDSRPLNEFRVMNIPGATDCPGAELVHRVTEAVRDPDTLVVVNCAGRTRSIIGAQSLIDAGLPNPVMALKNGTMGWHLAGFELEHGQTRMAAAPGVRARAQARDRAAQVARRFGVKAIDRATFEDWRRDAARTTCLFDVRTAEEFEAGHLPGAVHAPGGQLVQGTDSYVAVRNARIVLADDDGVRAIMTGHWLVQMGWPEVVTLSVPEGAAGLERGAAVAVPLGFAALEVQTLTVAGFAREQAAGGVEVLDFATSLQYRRGHLPGAAFAIRARLAAHLGRLRSARLVVCTSPDDRLARYAAQDLAGLGLAGVRVLEGGTRAWQATGAPLETGDTRLLEPPAEDVWYKPYDHASQIEAAMQDYLQWEVALTEQIARDPDMRFRDFPA